MGQAKQRGTFAQRQAEGIVKRQREELDRATRERLRLESLTPSGHAALRRTRAILAWAAGQGMLR